MNLIARFCRACTRKTLYRCIPFFAVQQAPVLSDLHLQPGLDVQQGLVVVALPSHVLSPLAQVILQPENDGLQLLELSCVALFRLTQSAFQRFFLLTISLYIEFTNSIKDSL